MSSSPTSSTSKSRGGGSHAHKNSLLPTGTDWASNPNPVPCDACVILQAEKIKLEKRLHEQTRQMYNMTVTEELPLLKRQIEFLRKQNAEYKQTITKKTADTEKTIQSYRAKQNELEKWSKTLATQEKKQVLAQRDLDWKNQMLLEKLGKYQEVIDIVEGINDTVTLEIERDGYVSQVSWINRKISERKAVVLDKIASRTKEIDASIAETKSAIKQLLAENYSEFWKEGACFSEITEKQKERFWRHHWLFHQYDKNPNDPSLQWDVSKEDDLRYYLKTNLLWSDERLES